MFAVKIEVVRKLLSDAKWAEKFSKAKSVEEAAEIVAEFCRAKGYRVKSVGVKERS